MPAQIVLFLDPNGEIRAEAPGVNGATRIKIETNGVIWPPEIIAALQEQATRIAARDAAIAEANRRNEAIYTERAKSSQYRPIPIKKTNRAEIHDTAASRPGANSPQFADETIGLRDRRKRVDFIARSHEHRPWQQITTYGETAGSWCRRNGWEQLVGGKTTRSGSKKLLTGFSLL